MVDKKSPIILIVDDDKYIRNSLKELISKWHIKTDEAENGAIAVEKLKDREYSLILLDLKMDKKNGMDVLEDMEKSNIETPLILITAYPNDRRLEEALKYNISLCLVKPLKADVLKKTIQHFINMQ